MIGGDGGGKWGKERELKKQIGRFKKMGGVKVVAYLSAVCFEAG